MNDVSSAICLGIEAGATHTTILCADAAGRVQHHFELGPGNVRLATPAELRELFKEMRRRTGQVHSIAAGMAGLRNDEDKTRVLALAAEVWPGVPFTATNDLEIALEAAGAWPDRADARVLLLSGTGSCAYGRNCEGRVDKFGGRGHILGDRGSACDIALTALRAIVYQHDLKERFPALGEAVLAALQLNQPDDLIWWSQQASKHEIAALAMVVFEEAQKHDRLAQTVVREAAEKLADMGARCAEHLVAADSMVQFILAGGVLQKQKAFAATVSRLLHERRPSCRVEKLKRDGVWGSVELARQALGLPPLLVGKGSGKTLTLSAQKAAPVASASIPVEVVKLSSLAASPTEQRLADSMHLDTLPLPDAIDLMIRQNVLAVEAVQQCRAELQWLIDKTIQAFRNGGRLFYIGAGTSGRLGVLDASECPPTFRVSREQVQGIIAGGRQAIWSAVEGAEDNMEAGADVVRYRGIKQGDVLLGIAASGRTPYVWGALAEAKRRGAVTALLAFNPHLQVAPEYLPDKLLLINAGPEVLTGSTRLKAGTATKVVLNTLTTLAMVHTGKVISNLMVDMNPSNVKLRDRAVRLVKELTGKDEDQVRHALEESGWVIKQAVTMLENSG